MVLLVNSIYRLKNNKIKEKLLNLKKSIKRVYKTQ